MKKWRRKRLESEDEERRDLENALAWSRPSTIRTCRGIDAETPGFEQRSKEGTDRNLLVEEINLPWKNGLLPEFAGSPAGNQPARFPTSPAHPGTLERLAHRR